MSSSFWLLGVESGDFFRVEKERTACKAKQIHKMTTIFIQKEHYELSFCEFAQLLTAVIFVAA